MAQADEKNSLLITPADIRLEEEGGSDFDSAQGYHLYVRKVPGLGSIMLTETTKDPSGAEDNYAYRATEYNKINGDEIRILDGKKLESETARYFLIDSTPEKDAQFGEAFHIFIPAEIVYGYSWSRNGRVKIGKGTFINIRGFEKEQCDYSGNYFDNPFMFNLELRTRPKPVVAEVITAPVVLPEPDPEPEFILTDDYNPVAATKFEEFSDSLVYSKGPETIVDDIMAAMEKITPKEVVDIVFAIDATGSMKDDIEILRKDWIPRIQEMASEWGNLRLGLLLYRDYGDNFNFRGLPVKFYNFTGDLNIFLKNLNGFTIRGNEGGDIPEAVYEALYASMSFYDWREDASKKVILIGDAEPHPRPRGTGKYSRELVEKTSVEKNISITAIITPDDKGRRGR